MSAAVPVRIGLLRLTDAATVIVAAHENRFAANGLDARLFIEPSWANVADKLAYGLLDAAVMLPPLAIATALGLRGPRPADLLVPMALSQGGISVTLGLEAARALPGRDAGSGIRAVGRAFGAWIAGMRARGRIPRLAVVHLFSGHNLLLRYWLAASGVDPDRDLELVVVPPQHMGAALEAGEVAGFCCGAPWGVLAETRGIGRVVALGSDIWHRHPEKVLAVRRGWADAHPNALAALLGTLIGSAAICDDPARGNDIAHLLSDPAYLDADAGAIRTSLGRLPGGADPRTGSWADPIAFLANGATIPWVSQAAWFARQMSRWGWLPAGRVAEATGLYRPDLYRAAAVAAGLPVPAVFRKIEGGHARPHALSTPTGPLALLPDPFCDGARFGEDGELLPAERA